MYPTIRDLETGEQRALPGWDWPVYWWMEGNGSCDCNRAIAMGADEVMHERQRREHPELQEHQQYCYGTKRFIAVDVHGDMEGLPKAEIIAAMNSGYPSPDNSTGDA